MNKNQSGSAATGTVSHSKLSVIFANGKAGFSDRSVLDHKAWVKHSGKAPTSGIDVHTLKSQKIAGTDSFAVCRDGDETNGPIITATPAELEVLMGGLGYEVKLKKS